MLLYRIGWQVPPLDKPISSPCCSSILEGLCFGCDACAPATTWACVQHVGGACCAGACTQSQPQFTTEGSQNTHKVQQPLPISYIAERTIGNKMHGRRIIILSRSKSLQQSHSQHRYICRFMENIRAILCYTYCYISTSPPVVLASVR